MNIDHLIKKIISDDIIVVDINDFSDVNEIINIKQSLNKRIFVLNKIINARLREHQLVLIKQDLFETIELYLFLFDDKLSEVDEKIYNSMRTLKLNFNA